MLSLLRLEVPFDSEVSGMNEARFRVGLRMGFRDGDWVRGIGRGLGMGIGCEFLDWGCLDVLPKVIDTGDILISIMEIY